MGTMRILDRTGDTAVAWHTDDQTSVELAEALFVQQRRLGRIPFARRAFETDAVNIQRFDPHAEEIIWLRPLQGG